MTNNVTVHDFTHITNVQVQFTNTLISHVSYFSIKILNVKNTMFAQMVFLQKYIFKNVN